MKKIRVLLIEDNRLLREGLAAMLIEQRDIALVASAGSAETAVKRKGLQPNIILLDLGLRSQNSLRVVESLKRHIPSARIIVMDLAPVQSELFEYVGAGVDGFVLKDATLDDFLSTIRTVAQGGKVLPTSLAGSLFSQIVDQATSKGKRIPTTLVRMTSREREVIDLIAEGLSNKEIAKRLYLATDTVKGHVHNILEKLALHTRLEVASYAHARRTEKPTRGNKDSA
ncbi:MAG: response regulator transcription factor [Ignavibacteriae bacterium]|nr:response regulator transcription factor [Ignavibacteriota bacterium]